MSSAKNETLPESPLIRPTDPDRETKLSALRALLKGLPADETAVFMDEVDVNLNPKVGCMWMKRGQQSAVETPGTNEKRYLAGSIHWRTGRVILTEGKPKEGRSPVLTVPPSVKLWFGGGVDLRLGFDGLSNLVRSQLHADPTSGHLFVFTNRSANRVKVLYWGGHGLCLWCSRLEAGRYHFPEATATGIELSAAQFAMILDGIDVSRVRRFKRYSPPAPTSSRYPSA